MKSVTVNPRSKVHAQTIADLFGVEPSKEMSIPMGAVDKQIEAYLRSQPTAPAPDSAALEYAPQRIDREIALTPVEEAERLKIEAQFLAATDKTAGYRAMMTARDALRTTAVLRNIPLDVQGLTLIYGLAHDKCLTIGCDGIHRHCHTLIHGTHATNPEDEYLRELQVTCDRIVRYYVPGLDDGRWQLLNQPLRWPMTPQEWRQLLLARLNEPQHNH